MRAAHRNPLIDSIEKRSNEQLKTDGVCDCDEIFAFALAILYRRGEKVRGVRGGGGGEKGEVGWATITLNLTPHHPASPSSPLDAKVITQTLFRVETSYHLCVFVSLAATHSTFTTPYPHPSPVQTFDSSAAETMISIDDWNQVWESLSSIENDALSA